MDYRLLYGQIKLSLLDHMPKILKKKLKANIIVLETALTVKS